MKMVFHNNINTLRSDGKFPQINEIFLGEDPRQVWVGNNIYYLFLEKVM